MLLRATTAYKPDEFEVRIKKLAKCMYGMCFHGIQLPFSKQLNHNKVFRDHFYVFVILRFFFQGVNKANE